GRQPRHRPRAFRPRARGGEGPGLAVPGHLRLQDLRRSNVKRVLLTGGTGFVGANLARSLVAQGHDVHFLVRPGHRSWRLAGLAGGVRLHEAELADRATVAAVAREVAAEWVFHLAAPGASPLVARVPGRRRHTG